MANEKILNTRIQLKYDSYEKWNGSSVVLKAGEIAIAHLGPANKDNSTHDSGQHPVLIKVGDGNHTFAQLPWLSALAADVYAWAKKENPDWNDFPALPIEVIDNGTGKFVTDVEYANNKITISRSDVDWDDIQNKPNFVNSIEAADASLEINPITGDVKAKAKLSAAEGNILRLENDGLYVPAPDEVTLPSYEDSAAALSFVTEVDQTNGKIATSKAALVQGTNITLTQDAIGGNITIAGKDWSGEIATALAEAKKHADDNDANDNTAHTHSAGDGLKLTGNGGIDGDTKYELNLAFGSLTQDNKLQLLDATTNAIVAEFNAAEFVEDSFLQEVTYSDEDGDNVLTFVFTLNNGDTRTVDVDLSHLVDVYTGHAGSTVTVTVDGYTVKAEVNEKSLTNAHIADNAAIAETKLEQNVQNALALARTALQSVEHPDYTDEFNSKKDKQEAQSGTLAGARVVASWSQDTNGKLIITDRDLTPADIGAPTKEEVLSQNAAILAEAQKYADSLNHEDTTYRAAANGGLKLNENNEFAIDDSITFIFYCGTSSELVD